MASMTKWETPSYNLDPQHRYCIGKNTVIECPECNGNLRNSIFLQKVIPASFAARSALYNILAGIVNRKKLLDKP
ncbi:hypothetical protein GX50_06501 [[Emmonsia] crescens]|uniref:Uncharacterized protein n=1 Tax=[Emmonsia] crescens TaxID=73230 RepID=A0A2B7ZC02_9EURO|nr:hypothetical protein GX50_06501 [Emmonsia crescens]